MHDKQGKKKASSERLEKIFYRREEAAFVLGIGIRLVDDLIANKHLTPRRLGRCVVIHRSDIKRVEQEILADGILQPGVPRSV